MNLKPMALKKCVSLYFGLADSPLLECCLDPLEHVLSG